MENRNTQKQAVSLLLGTAVGDALGVPVEFRPRGSFRVADMQGYGSHNQPPGTWSDDTSLALCLADSLSCGFDLGDVARNFVRWRDNGDFTAHGDVFDIGISTAKAISRLTSGVAPEKAGCAGVNENGNGSLMRIAPLVFYLADKPEAERFQITQKVSAITHAHEWSVFDRILRSDIRALPESAIKSGGFVIDTFEATFWCFLTTGTFRDAVLKAVNLGDDTDTTAAVCGALAGLAYGADAIPAEWLDVLAGCKMIRRLAARMTDAITA
jgi:ADP-ribosylglycohydrolase